MATCAACPAPVGGPFAKYCHPCAVQRRGKKPKYIHTERTDDIVRKAAASRERGRYEWAAHRLGWPRYIVTHRAQALGLCAVKEKRWTAPELEILERHAWMGSQGIARVMKAAGFHRTVTAITVKRKRVGATAVRQDGYTVRRLADALGVDPHWVLVRINRGAITAERRETSSPLDQWYISDAAASRFVRDFIAEIDIRHVDKFWLVDVLSGGAA